jgi:alkylhydroperoxidase family enzyme
MSERALEVRVPLRSVEEAKQAGAAVGIDARLAELNIFRALLHHPRLARVVADLLLTLLFGGKLDARLRELVIMRIGWVTGSEYEWTQHWRIATQLGIPAEDLLALRAWRSSRRLGAADRAVLAATDETLETGTITRETWAACEAHVGSPEALLELVAAIGTWRLISSLLRSLEIPLEAGVEPWPPDGVRPSGRVASGGRRPGGSA